MVKLALILALAAAAPAASTAVQPLGDLQLRYDPAKWEARVQDGVLNVSQVNGPERRHALSGRAVAGLTCTPEAMLDRVDVTSGFKGVAQEEVLPSGLTLAWATGDLGCRNRAPTPFAACVRHKGRAYLFDSGLVGCRFGVGAGGGLPLLREGLEPR